MISKIHFKFFHFGTFLLKSSLRIYIEQKVENLFGPMDAPLPYPQISSYRLQKNLDSDSWTDVGYREYEEYREYDIYNNMLE